MALNFNVSPYYDDFDPNKNFHRILFKPGYAVQARELTQSQTILQNQISEFADHVFQKNTPVSGAKVTYNVNANYVKLEPTIGGTSIDISQFENILVQNQAGDVVARVVAIAEATGTETTGGDPDTLILSYISGNHFQNGDIIYSVFNPNISAQAISSDATGSSSVASISEGIFYVVNGFSLSEVTGSRYSIGHFVRVQPQTTILSKYSQTPSVRVGLNITETINDYVDDVSLLDPASGAPNYQGPGADRYTIILDLETRTLTLGDDQNFIELMRIENGQIQKQVDGTIYATIDEYFAKRTFEESGDYIVNDFKLTPSSNTSNSNLYDLKVGKGVAYVRGYRLENQGEVTLTSNRSRTTDSLNNNSTFIEYGNYIQVDSANGVFDVTTMPSIDLHVVDKGAIATTNATTYNATVAASAVIRGLEFDYYTNIDSIDSYVYKAYLGDIQNKSLSGTAVAATQNTITFPGLGFSATANAYYGVTLSIDSGSGAGDVKRIVSYNGTTRTATVDSPFTQTPSTSSFTLRFDIKDVETMVHLSSGTTIDAWASINESTGKLGSTSIGDTILVSKVSPELIYTLGYPYASGISDASYTTTQVFRGVAFNGVGPVTTPSITFDNSKMQFLGTSHENYIVINESTGSIVSFANTSVRSISLSGGNKTLVMQADDISTAFNATIIAKVSITEATDKNHFLKIKNLVKANTTAVNLSGTSPISDVYVDLNNGQTWIKNAALVTPGQPQSLYVSDVKRIVKIIDTKSPLTIPSDAMLLNSSYDVTRNFIFDNGQRDSYYAHSSIRLKPGRQKPTGDLLVVYDYYSHSGGDGYFSVDSYLAPNSTSPENYGEIGTYSSKSGTLYNLRDCLDFRPTVKNAQPNFVFDYTTDPTTTDAGIYIPTDDSIFTSDYSYYLARRDKLVLSKDKNFEIIEGTPSVNPLLPGHPDGSLVIANLIHQPYTNYVPGEAPVGQLPNLSVEKVQHRRWTMQDISDLNTRVNNIEYYTALNTLEKNAQALQIPDVNGLNRFKNGILVDDFSSFATADTANEDFNASINRRERKMSASQIVDNFPLESTYLVSSVGKLGANVASTLGFTVHSIGETNIFTLPYATANLASQTLASNTVNINPFATPLYEGVVSLNPPMDNWVDNTKQPDLLLVDPDLQIYQSSESVNLLSVGDWKVIPGTTTQTSQTIASGRNWNTVETKTYASTQQTNVLGYYEKLGSSYYTNNGFITDISILPYIRPQSLLFKAKGLLINTPISTWFDGINVDNYIVNPDIIELTNVSGTFLEDDIIGFYVNNTFYPIATVVSTYVYPGTNNVRLNVVGNFHTSFDSEFSYSTIRNATLKADGSYNASTASGTIASSKIVTTHRTGFVGSVGGTFTDADSNSTSLKRVSNPAYCSPLNNMGVWWRDNRSTGSVSFNVTFPVTGTYTFNFAADNYGSMSIDSVAKITLTGSTVSNYSQNHTASVAGITAGVHKITFSATNTGGPAAFYGSIIDSNGNKIFDTISYIPQPSLTSTVTQMPGGGQYFTGVTKLSLSDIAPAQTNYYVGSTIKVTSTWVATNPVTGAASTLSTTGTAQVVSYDINEKTITLSAGVDVSIGFNTLIGGSVTSFYTLDGLKTSYLLAKTSGGLPKLSTDEAGNFVGVFNIPPNTFKTGERVFRIDNRTTPADPNSSTTVATATFTASGLATKSQALEFAPSIDSARNSFTQTSYRTNQLQSVSTRTYSWDPVAQSFIISEDNYPNGAFLRSIKFFFQKKPTNDNTPVTLSIVGTQNGYPNGETLPHSIVTKYPSDIKVSSTPHHLDSNTYTEFVFEAPVYIQPGVLYALILKSNSTDYNVWIAAHNAQAVPSTVKNLPTDPTPSTITKIGTVPYVGSLFESQNALTWTANQGKSLMFVMERCLFDTSKTPKLPFVIPQNLPTRKLTTQSISRFYDANTVSNVLGVSRGQDIASHAYNITTTDFVPSTATINYTYKSTLELDKSLTGEFNLTPGKYGCPTYDDIYLNDGKGERVLIANSNTSFFVYTTLTSGDDTVSPVISDDGLSLYNIRWNINNMELSNDSITVVDGGTGYNVSTTVVTVSPPDDIYGTQAYATANISGGVIQTIDFVSEGSGYWQTPTVTVSDPTTRGGNSNTSIVVHGETSTSGGNGIAKYFTKKVVLTPGNDSGDLRVYYTAYRPIGTNILVYYKLLNRNDTQNFEDGDWQLMTTVSNRNTYSLSRSNTYEFEAAPGTAGVADNFVSYTSTTGETYSSFSQFAIKVVLTTNDKTNVPFLTDIRAVALPPGAL